MRKINKLFAVAATTALVLTGCVGGKKEEKQADPNKKVEITYWDFPQFTKDKEFKKTEDFDAALIKAFEAKNPNIKVNYQKIEFTDGPAKVETAIQSKTAPDVIYDAPGRIIAWAAKDLLVPLDDIDKSKLNEAAVKASSYKDKLYMYPQGVAPFLMGVNKDLTDKLGVTDLLPLNKQDRSWTVDEYEKFLKAVKQKDSSITPALFYTKSQAGDQGPRAFVANLYNSWITDDANSKYTINDANGVKGLEWVKKAYDDGLLGQGVALEAKDALEAFKSGRAATTILFSPGIAASHASGFNYKFLPFPNNGGKAKYDYLVAGPAIFDNGDVDKAAAAKKFVDFMVNDKDWGKRTLLASGNFSAKKGETGLYDSEELKFAEGLTGQYATYYNTIPGFAKMRPLWFNMVQGVLNGKTSPKEGLDKFVEDANKTIKEAL
ncbi:ABC transporter substrate-binding protein [Gemella haemolysans]|uniref:ABC transporter, solute-binding protein n=1 Tax=Gemella haemolysans ATCC 10379 TaxID=546270 RepID=C5NU90_9BACL|nr:extracellular solute-binding protein [Gemella haemolysans]EER69228.1 ABC transporter, solute-binding protein [Gemella haemolysans ATCC 10379]KAA8706692.1 extracellular solute-binding protein [Gemella haemolysans]UBH82538.1 extracellular solute-binding protein [Gemella haemolysans]VEI39214.1 Maltose-binding periplasmic proteins/domains [Gemella haemolysans]